MLLNWLNLSIAIAICAACTADTPLKCWRCSSTTDSFCDDPFNPNTLSVYEKRWAYTKCPRPPTHLNRNGQAYNFIPVCKKAIRNVDGNRVLSRSCHWVNGDTPKGECLQTVSESHTRTEFCETCTTDGCNRF